MKWILRFLPRSFLIRMSLFQPPLRIYFKGSRFIDPIDGSGTGKLLPYEIMAKLCVPMLLSGHTIPSNVIVYYGFIWIEKLVFKSKSKGAPCSPEQGFFTGSLNNLSIGTTPPPILHLLWQT